MGAGAGTESKEDKSGRREDLRRREGGSHDGPELCDQEKLQVATVLIAGDKLT